MITLCSGYVFDLIVVDVCLCALCLKSYVRIHDKQSNEERFEKPRIIRRERERETEYKNERNKKAESSSSSFFFTVSDLLEWDKMELRREIKGKTDTEKTDHNVLLL